MEIADLLTKRGTSVEKDAALKALEASEAPRGWRRYCHLVEELEVALRPAVQSSPVEEVA